MDNNTASDAVASDAVSTVEQPATKKAKVDSGIPERKSANSESETASDAVRLPKLSPPLQLPTPEKRDSPLPRIKKRPRRAASSK